MANLLEVTSSKETSDPFLDRWGGKRLSLTFESHKDFGIMVAAQASLWNVCL